MRDYVLYVMVHSELSLHGPICSNVFFKFWPKSLIVLSFIGFGGSAVIFIVMGLWSKGQDVFQSDIRLYFWIVLGLLGIWVLHFVKILYGLRDGIGNMDNSVGNAVVWYLWNYGYRYSNLDIQSWNRRWLLFFHRSFMCLNIVDLVRWLRCILLWL